MKGLILSGGKGTRLYPLTFTTAKQLIPVANKPVLFHVIETIRDAGIDEIGVVVGVGDMAEAVKTAIGDGSQWRVHITPIVQQSPDGLAHAVKISQDFLGDESFVMFLGDNVIQGGISSLIRDFSHHPEWNAQVVLKAVENPQQFGVAQLREDGTIERLIEKPPQPPSNLALIGVYMFDSHIFEAVNSIQPSRRGELEITDAIQWLIDHRYTVSPHIHQGWWIDTGRPIDMLDANATVLEETPASIAPDAIIENSTVDKRVTLESGARVINSVIQGPTIIGRNTVIEDSYIAPFTSIYHDVKVKNCEIERCIILERSQLTNLGARLYGSLIGRNTIVGRKEGMPRAITMNLGDHSNVLIV